MDTTPLGLPGKDENEWISYTHTQGSSNPGLKYTSPLGLAGLAIPKVNGDAFGSSMAIRPRRKRHVIPNAAFRAGMAIRPRRLLHVILNAKGVA
jgi:hypothetical protein